MEQPCESAESTQKTQSNPCLDSRRGEVVLLKALGEALADGKSLLQFALENNVPESTMRYWVSRMQACGAPESFVRFVETPEGLEVLHRLTVAATFTITQLAGGGVRAVCAFLELSGLWRVVAAGYGTQQQAVQDMEEAINTFGTEEREKLAAKLSPREIAVAQDETFHEDPCLVAIEPSSGYILLEEYAQDRTAGTWAAAMERALNRLPVKVFQSTSDEGAALLKVARDTGAHHSPDLFHVQQDISRATSLPLQRKVDVAEQAATEVAIAMESLVNEVTDYDAEPRGPGRPRNYDKRFADIETRSEEAEKAIEKAKDHRKDVRDAARAISRSYHPFDLDTGAPRDADTVKNELEEHMARIEKLATEAKLSARCIALLAKAKRVLPQMVATVAFAHSMIREKVEALKLATEVAQAVLRYLIPLRYLEQVQRKAPTAEARSALRSTIAALQAAVDEPGGALARLPDDIRAVVEQVASVCAQIFQRSSSCVEGRNGYLSLRHHSIHQLTPRKLGALTVLHNFFIRRMDGTTAAERFFGHKHRDLFEYLLITMPPPKRPAARRTAVHVAK